MVAEQTLKSRCACYIIPDKCSIAKGTQRRVGNSTDGLRDRICGESGEGNNQGIQGNSQQGGIAGCNSARAKTYGGNAYGQGGGSYVGDCRNARPQEQPHHGKGICKTSPGLPETSCKSTGKGGIS